MEIKILEISGEESIKQAAMMPYQTQTKDAAKLAYRVWKANHRSIARHSNISLEIKDISQDALRQLSRHPHINLTVKSTRYCDFTDTKMFMPEWVKEMPLDLKLGYEATFNHFIDIYKKWQKIEQENGQEDTAKLFLPLMSTTDLIMSANIQAMYEFLMLRNCVRASEEIREMSRNITKLLAEKDGLVGMIFSDLDCKGKEYGYCPEHDKCGKY
jgi:thymidylate synthase (FAD)